MKKTLLGLCALIVMTGGMSFAATIPLTLTPVDFNDLGTLTPVAGWPAMTTTMQTGTLRGDVISQPFQDAGGDYVYLYQVKNTGLDNWHMIEVFSIWPFNGADGQTQVGYLTANQPAGFTAGTIIPTGASVKTTTLGGPTVSFGFPGYITPIDTGETGKVLYIKSALPPTTAVGNIIDGTIAQGMIIANVPEPATIGLLAMGGVACLGSLRKRRS